MNRSSNPPPPAPPSSSRPAEELIEEAFALGVPHDYGRARGLRRVREPRNLAFIGYDLRERPQWLASRAAIAWSRMREAAMNEGVELQIVSAFRTIEYQVGILKRKRDRGLSIDEILLTSAAPGFSEHHSGRAVDITTPGFVAVEEEFERSEAFAWLSTNAKRYGFRMSYPRNNRHGITYEPWHWCWHAR